MSQPSSVLRVLATALLAVVAASCGQCGGPASDPAAGVGDDPAADPAAPPAAPPSPVALEVDGTPVLDAETLEARVQEMVERYERVAGRPETTARWRNQRRRRIVQEALQDHLIAREVARQGIVVTDEDIDAVLAEDLGHIHGNPQLFARYLESRGVTAEVYREGRRAEIAESRLLETRGALEPTEAERLAFYEENRERWRAEERIRASTITIRLPSTAPEDQAVRARERLDEARRRIVDGGEPFSVVAEQVSMGPERRRGGEMGWVMRGRRTHLVADGVEDVIFSLPPGEVSHPIRTELGYQLFLVHEHRAEGVRQLDELEDHIGRPLRRQLRQRLRLELVRELENDVSVTYREEHWGIEPE